MKDLVTERLSLKDLYPERAEALAKEHKIDVEDLELVRKGIIAEKAEVDKDERSVTSYINTAAKDRDNEVIEPKGVVLTHYRKNPIVPWAHDYKSLPVGKNIWIKKDDKGLLAKTVFLKHAFAEDVYRLYSEDVAGTGPAMKAWSIGFVPLKWETPDLEEKGRKVDEADTRVRRTYKKWELLEYSPVPVPSNPEALTEMVAKGLIKSDKLKKEIEKYIEIEDDALRKERGLQELEKLDNEYNDYVYNLEDVAKIITKPEETDDFIRIPVRDCKVTATITISEKQGITALYCGKIKKIRTYIFNKKPPYNWTMKKAQAWVKDHGKAVDGRIDLFFQLSYFEFPDDGFEQLEEVVNMDSQKQLEELITSADGEVIELVGKDEDIKVQKPEYKERWNKSLPKVFDISEVESPKPKPFSYELYGKFLDCKIKEIFKNTYSVPSPLIGTYLAGLKEILTRFDLKDTRSFSWDGTEMPPEYAVIQLNSTQSDDFLMRGISFYDADGTPLIVKYMPEWNGFNISFITSSQHKEWNKELLTEIHKWVEENNFLKGEKFSLSGEFLDKSEDGWDDLILKPETKDILRKSAGYLMKKKDNLASRGLLFIGPPGTGKTKTGRVLMNKADATFIWVSSRDFRRVGPLSALTLSFSLARGLAPTILFIEDIDTWLKEYGNHDSVVVDLLKTELDGIKQNKGIINILTSNYPERLPDALLDRPGRFHHIVSFELPKAEQREEMLVLWAGEIENDLLRKIVKETEEFSGAHIRELVDYAYIIAEENEIDVGEAIMKSLEKLREQRDLISEIRENRKSLREILENRGMIELIDKEEKPTEREQQITRELFDRTIEQLNKIEEELANLKEGRILSAKNRKLIQDALEAMEAAIPPLKTLLTATEPPQREELELEVEEDTKKWPTEDKGSELEIDKFTDKLDPSRWKTVMVEKITSILKDKLNKARGKVE